MSKVLLDSNILIYALDSGSPFHANATKLLHDPNLDFYISTKNISEFFAVCSKLNIPFSNAWVFYQSLCQNAQLLFPDSNSLAVFENLLKKYQPKGNRVTEISIRSI